jgi:Domain of unknown function (DUF4383)
LTNTFSSTRANGVHDGDPARGSVTPAQWYCMLAGAGLLLAGAFGFIADATFDVDNGVQGDSFLGFEVNGWHNLVHVASGAVLLAAAWRAKSAKTVAIAFGVVYGLVAIIGLIDGSDVLGFIPVNAADNVLHIVLSAAGIVAGLISRSDTLRRDDERTNTGRFTRDSATVVESERPHARTQ